MAWQPQETVLIRTVMYRDSTVQRERDSYGYNREKGRFQEWLTKCGGMVVGFTRADGSGTYTQAMDRVWAWQAHLLGLSFCQRCFPPDDRPDGIGPTNWWRLDDR